MKGRRVPRRPLKGLSREERIRWLRTRYQIWRAKRELERRLKEEAA